MVLEPLPPRHARGSALEALDSEELHVGPIGPPLEAGIPRLRETG
jgi:hypothetical protein